MSSDRADDAPLASPSDGDTVNHPPCADPEPVLLAVAGAPLRLYNEIARGGMGAILRGRDDGLGRDVAVKVLLEEHRGKPGLVRRFLEEARIAGQLQHPGVVPVYGLGELPDGRPYFQMKLVKGRTLAEQLAARKEPAEDRGRFLKVFEQVCQALAYAHSKGVLHRDLKPANVMVGAFGEVQVMDWGLAKVLTSGGREPPVASPPTSASVIDTLRAPGIDGTQAGAVMGTPQYMAPEQARGEVETLDARADVFGLGAILCEVLTGQPPFVGADVKQIMRRAARGDVADAFARLGACGTDAELAELAKRCLAAEPEERPADAGVLARELGAYLESVEERLRRAELERARAEVRAAEARKRHRLQLTLAGAMLLLIAATRIGGCALQQRTRVVGEANQLREDVEALRNQVEVPK